MAGATHSVGGGFDRQTDAAERDVEHTSSVCLAFELVLQADETVRRHVGNRRSAREHAPGQLDGLGSLRDDELIRRADEALYRAKQEGRNRVEQSLG